MVSNYFNASTNRERGLSGSTIKMIAIIAMLIDHIAAVVIEPFLSSRGLGYILSGNNMDGFSLFSVNGIFLMLYFVMRLIGRFGYPIFCFLLLEGFQHTHSKLKYALRLFIFALISEVPFDLAFSNSYFYSGYQNVFLTLFLGLISLIVYEALNERIKRSNAWKTVSVIVGLLIPSFYISIILYNNAIRYQKLQTPAISIFLPISMVLCSIILVIVFLIRKGKKGLDQACIFIGDFAVLAFISFVADNLHTDYSGFGILTITFMYLFRNSRVKEMVAGCIVLTISNISEATTFFMVPVISRYNGKRGWNIKYFFYAFYPVHLFLLYLIRLLLGIR